MELYKYLSASWNNRQEKHARTHANDQKTSPRHQTSSFNNINPPAAHRTQHTSISGRCSSGEKTNTSINSDMARAGVHIIYLQTIKLLLTICLLLQRFPIVYSFVSPSAVVPYHPHVVFSSSRPHHLRASNTGEDIMPKDEENPRLATLRVHGPDSQGIVAAFSQLLYGHGCGIFDAEQFTDRSCSLFFQRIHFDYKMMHTDRISLEKGIKEVCERFSMNYKLNWGDQKKKVCIMVSKYDHCLWELLLRHRNGELDCDIVLIVSNHPDLKPIADSFNIPCTYEVVQKAYLLHYFLGLTKSFPFFVLFQMRYLK